MSQRRFFFSAFTGLALLVTPLLAADKPPKLAEQLLSSDKNTRMEAIQQFNKMPSDAQYKLVPDFMVAMSDENPEVRKIAARILKAMGVMTEGAIPDATTAKTPEVGAPAVGVPDPNDKKDKWAEEKKARDDDKGDDKWGDLKKIKEGDGGQYADLKQQLELEKKGQVTLNPSELHGETASGSTALAAVTDSLKDPSPWVRAQGARRLAMIHPAPVETIPTLITMINDKDVDARRAAVAALGSFGHLAQDAILPLNAALSDPDAGVRGLAEEALTQIRQP